MSKVLVKGWNYGLRKISLTKLFQDRANLPLDIAKGKTDSLLNNETFIIEVKNFEEAEDLVKEATAIGAVCKIVKDND